jgi:hypothetical protein
MDKGVAGVGRGCHRLRTAFRKFTTAADRAAPKALILAAAKAFESGKSYAMN